MNTNGITLLSDMRCPGCHKLLNATAPVNANHFAMPMPGNLTICIACGMVLIFTGEKDAVRGLRQLTEKEWFALHMLTRAKLVKFRRTLPLTHVLTIDWRYTCEKAS